MRKKHTPEKQTKGDSWRLVGNWEKTTESTVRRPLINRLKEKKRSSARCVCRPLLFLVESLVRPRKGDSKDEVTAGPWEQVSYTVVCSDPKNQHSSSLGPRGRRQQKFVFYSCAGLRVKIKVRARWVSVCLASDECLAAVCPHTAFPVGARVGVEKRGRG